MLDASKFGHEYLNENNLFIHVKLIGKKGDFAVTMEAVTSGAD